MTDRPTRAARLYRALTPAAFALTLIVVVLGAWVRLTDAGLGCPDWPGCYGQIGVPDSAEEIRRAESAFPERPVDSGKAWREMIHRYFASTLGLLIVVIAAAAWLNRRDEEQPLLLPSLLLAVVIAQGQHAAQQMRQHDGRLQQQCHG
ncbi:MAG: COX15/CtaA family protein, partial [Pseudomonadota bacterium]